MQIGQRLKVARKAIGFTLEKAASESGIGQSSLSEFENDKREPKFSQLSKLAEVYRKAIEFFLTDEPIIEDMMLWRDKPNTKEEMETKAQFSQLCEQYHRLEVLVEGKARISQLPQPDAANSENFTFNKAKDFAKKVQIELCLGDIPSASLKQTLEENFFVKIFHLAFPGSAISTVSNRFGYAVLLNAGNKLWRRNYDLAHELFHLLTWNIFRQNESQDSEPSEHEEKLANAFASWLLLPTDIVKSKMEAAMSDKSKVTFEALDEIAREFGVSLEALLWRLLYLYNKSGEDIEKYIEQSKMMKMSRPLRQSDTPDKLPERYCSLAIRALNEGRLSLMQFAKYMSIGYKQAQAYLAEDEDFTDEKISISVA